MLVTDGFSAGARASSPAELPMCSGTPAGQDARSPMLRRSRPFLAASSARKPRRLGRISRNSRGFGIDVRNLAANPPYGGSKTWSSDGLESSEVSDKVRDKVFDKVCCRAVAPSPQQGLRRSLAPYSTHTLSSSYVVESLAQLALAPGSARMSVRDAARRPWSGKESSCQLPSVWR